MLWSTPVHISSDFRIGLNESFFTIGSCFSEELSQRLQAGQIPVHNGNFGTLFHPEIIWENLRRVLELQYFTEEDLIKHQGRFFSLHHSSQYSGDTAEVFLKLLNQNLEVAHRALLGSKTLVITFGTAFYYFFLPLQKKTANCHKIPSQYFQKFRSTTEEICESFRALYPLLKTKMPFGFKILLTVSPVRHTREGMSQNMMSKSILRVAAGTLAEEFSEVDYLPVYEVFMDELRDYRFYKEDFIHPTAQAVDYVMDKVRDAYFDEKLQSFYQENIKIHKALQHRPLRPESTDYQNFMLKLKEQMLVQQEKVRYPIFTEYLPTTL